MKSLSIFDLLPRVADVRSIHINTIKNDADMAAGHVKNNKSSK